MDFQNRVGSKTGSGGVASWSETNRDRRERLRQLALETIDLNKDPYFMKNHLGSYECKLCLTLHTNEGSYLAHTQGKKHQQNLARRAAKEAKEAPIQPAPERTKISVKKFVKIGRPGYKVTKQRDADNGQHSLLFQIDYPEIAEGIPKHRFMSAYEQRIEPPDKQWQYLLVAAEPYETISFKIPSREIDKGDNKFWTYWNKDTKQFFVQFYFKLTHSQIAQMQREAEDQKRVLQAREQAKRPPPLRPPPQNNPPPRARPGLGHPSRPEMRGPPPTGPPPPLRGPPPGVPPPALSGPPPSGPPPGQRGPPPNMPPPPRPPPNLPMPPPPQLGNPPPSSQAKNVSQQEPPAGAPPAGPPGAPPGAPPPIGAPPPGAPPMLAGAPPPLMPPPMRPPMPPPPPSGMPVPPPHFQVNQDQG